MILHTTQDPVTDGYKRSFGIFSDTKETVRLFTFVFHYSNFHILTPHSLEIIGNPACAKTKKYKHVQSESALFALIKAAMNHLTRVQNYLQPDHSYPSWIKKKMVKDGHLTDESRFYVREKSDYRKNRRMLNIRDDNYAIRNAHVELRTVGSVTLAISDLNPQEKDNAQ